MGGWYAEADSRETRVLRARNSVSRAAHAWASVCVCMCVCGVCIDVGFGARWFRRVLVGTVRGIKKHPRAVSYKKPRLYPASVANESQ